MTQILTRYNEHTDISIHNIPADIFEKIKAKRTENKGTKKLCIGEVELIFFREHDIHE